MISAVNRQDFLLFTTINPPIMGHQNIRGRKCWTYCCCSTYCRWRLHIPYKDPPPTTGSNPGRSSQKISGDSTFTSWLLTDSKYCLQICTKQLLYGRAWHEYTPSLPGEEGRRKRHIREDLVGGEAAFTRAASWLTTNRPPVIAVGYVLYHASKYVKVCKYPTNLGFHFCREACWFHLYISYGFRVKPKTKQTLIKSTYDIYNIYNRVLLNATPWKLNSCCDCDRGWTFTHTHKPVDRGGGADFALASLGWRY